MIEHIEAMTSTDMALWLRVGVGMGYPVDELGHPYREGKAYELDGHPYKRLHDFNPLKDPADAMRVQVFFNLSVDVEQSGDCRGMVVVREDRGPILHVVPFDEKSLESRVKAACVAITEAAAKKLSRDFLRQGTGAGD